MSRDAARQPLGGRLCEEAASWFLKLKDPSCTDAERSAFNAWLAADEANQAEFRQFERLWQTLDSSRPQLKRRLHKAALTAFALVATLALLATLAPPTERQLIVTGIGERRHLVLADGSVLDVNAASRIRTDYSWFSRRIEVEAGEALFAVTPEQLRLFEVHAGNGRIRDIGTTFEVGNRSGKVMVSVIEGNVEVRLEGRSGGLLLEAGQRLAYTEAGATRARPLDADAVAAWRTGRWIFKDTELEEVVATMNRQHRRQTSLSDASLAHLRVSGVFDISDRDGLLKALETLYPLRAQDNGESTRLVRFAGK